MRQLIFLASLLATVVLETSTTWPVYWGLLVALLLNFSFSRTWSYIFLAVQVFLVALLRLQVELVVLVVGDLLLLKLAELLTFHFSHSRDSWLRYVAGAGLVVVLHSIMIYVTFWQYGGLLVQQLLLNVLVGCLLWLLLRPFQRWLASPEFAILAK